MSDTDRLLGQQSPSMAPRMDQPQQQPLGMGASNNMGGMPSPSLVASAPPGTPAEGPCH